MLKLTLNEFPLERSVKARFVMETSLLVRKQGELVGHDPEGPKPMRILPPDRSIAVGFLAVSLMAREILELVSEFID